jgi:hypothetical protein
MRTNAAAADDLLAEARSVAARSGGEAAVGRPEDYLGATDLLIDLTLDTAGRHGEDPR